VFYYVRRASAPDAAVTLDRDVTLAPSIGWFVTENLELTGIFSLEARSRMRCA